MATTALRDHPLPGTPALDTLLEQIAEGANQREREREAPFEAIELIKRSGLGALASPSRTAARAPPCASSSRC